MVIQSYRSYSCSVRWMDFNIDAYHVYTDFSSMYNGIYI